MAVDLIGFREKNEIKVATLYIQYLRDFQNVVHMDNELPFRKKYI